MELYHVAKKVKKEGLTRKKKNLMIYTDVSLYTVPTLVEPLNKRQRNTFLETMAEEIRTKSKELALGQYELLRTSAWLVGLKPQPHCGSDQCDGTVCVYFSLIRSIFTN